MQETMHFEAIINAPVKKVWDTMLGQETYRQWTTAFNEGSRFEGSWDQGSRILFMGPDPETGKDGGMVSRIKENRPYEFISIEHLGMIKDGVEDTTSEEVRKWTPAFENYTLVDKEGKTELKVDLEMKASDMANAMKEMFEEAWPKALEKLKELCEK